MKKIFLILFIFFSYVFLIQDSGAVLIKYDDEIGNNFPGVTGITRTVTIKSVDSEKALSESGKNEIEKKYRLKGKNAFFSKTDDYSQDIVQILSEEKLLGGSIVFFDINNIEQLNSVRLITKKVNSGLKKVWPYNEKCGLPPSWYIFFHGKSVTEQFVKTLENEIENENDTEENPLQPICFGSLDGPLSSILSDIKAEGYGLKDYF